MQTKSIINYKKWDIVLVPFPFTDLSSVKKRPSLVISPDIYNENDDIIIAFVTSNIPEQLKPGDYRIKHWKESGLLANSLVRIKLATIKKSIVYKKLGSLHHQDCAEFLKVFINFFST